MRPDENRLEALIGAAFDRLPEPETARLNAVEAQLVRRAARTPRERRWRSTFWWLLAALTATGAAAWWAGEYFTEGSPTPAIEQVVPAIPEKPERDRVSEPVPAIEPREQSPASSPPGPAKEPPTIYRREMY